MGFLGAPRRLESRRGEAKRWVCSFTPSAIHSFMIVFLYSITDLFIMS